MMNTKNVVRNILGDKVSKNKMTAKDVLKTKGYTDSELNKMENKRIHQIAFSICGYDEEDKNV